MEILEGSPDGAQMDPVACDMLVNGHTDSGTMPVPVPVCRTSAWHGAAVVLYV